MIMHYLTGPDAVSVKLPNRWLDANRGEPVEVSEEEALLLIPLGWEEAPAEPTTAPLED